MDIGYAIKFYRVRRGMTQIELAAQAGLSVSYLSLLERNKRDPVLSTLDDIAGALGVSLTLLFFVASENQELAWLGQELVEKLSYAALKQEDMQS